MTQTTASGITIDFADEHRTAADLLTASLPDIIAINDQLWGVPAPSSCRVFIATSGVRFLFASAPWYLKPLYVLFLPISVGRVRRSWKEAGGWTIRYRSAPVVALKPPELLVASDRRLGERIFEKETELNEKFRHVACHELTHAFTSHLRLPLWLNEGLAMLAVDEFFGRQTVRADTLEILGRDIKRVAPLDYRHMGLMDDETFVAHYARSYWVTRYLWETQPEFVRSIVQQGRPAKELDAGVASALAVPLDTLWERLDRTVHEHFASGVG